MQSKLKREWGRNVQAKHTASDVTSLFEAFLWVWIILLAFQKRHVFRHTPDSYMLRRRCQNRRRRDRIPCPVHRIRRHRSRFSKKSLNLKSNLIKNLKFISIISKWRNKAKDSKSKGKSDWWKLNNEHCLTFSAADSRTIAPKRWRTLCHGPF